jgi:hypothetical protein
MLLRQQAKAVVNWGLAFSISLLVSNGIHSALFLRCKPMGAQAVERWRRM